MSFKAGMAYPWRGAGHLLRHPATWPLVAVPIAITLVVFFGTVALSWWLVPVWLSWLWAPGPQHSALVWLAYRFVTNLVRALALLTVGVVMYFTAGLVAVPFNDRLSAEVEAESGGPNPLPFRWADVPISVAHSALSLGVWALVVAALWALEAVPLLGSLLHLLGSIAATALLLGREMMDGAMSRRRWSYRAKLDFVWSHRSTVLGFGVVASAVLMVPLLNALFLPVVVAGGTKMFVDLEQAC